MNAFEMLPPEPFYRRPWFHVLQGAAAMLLFVVFMWGVIVVAAWGFSMALSRSDVPVLRLPLAQWQCTDQRSAVVETDPLTWCMQWSRR